VSELLNSGGEIIWLSNKAKIKIARESVNYYMNMGHISIALEWLESECFHMTNEIKDKYCE